MQQQDEERWPVWQACVASAARQEKKSRTGNSSDHKSACVEEKWPTHTFTKAPKGSAFKQMVTRAGSRSQSRSN